MINLQNNKTRNNTKFFKQKKIIWVSLIIIILISISVLLNLPDEENVRFIQIQTDKNVHYSEIVGNMYRNTKYKFRIKFPKGWKIETGDGAHIVQKASFENSVISIIIQQFDFDGSEGFSSIKETGTPKEFVNTTLESIKEKFSDVQIIDYGETKIDNAVAYWLEYSANSQILDYHLKTTNIIYSIAKGDIIYSISAGTATAEKEIDTYLDMKPLFLQTVGTFVFEN